jgi:hypothetical protein
VFGRVVLRLWSGNLSRLFRLLRCMCNQQSEMINRFLSGMMLMTNFRLMTGNLGRLFAQARKLSHGLKIVT